MAVTFIKSRPAWWIIFLGALAPLLIIVPDVIGNSLGAEPGKTLLIHFGESAIIFLLLTLSVTPLNRLSPFQGVVRYRRMVGLYCLFYAVLHVLSYLLFVAAWDDFIEDLYKRPYIIVGFLALLIIISLGVTSPKAMVRKLGKQWKSLHRAIYLAAILVVVHVWWQSRSDYGEAALYTLILVILFSFRLSTFKSMLRFQKR